MFCGKSYLNEVRSSVFYVLSHTNASIECIVYIEMFLNIKFIDILIKVTNLFTFDDYIQIIFKSENKIINL